MATDSCEPAGGPLRRNRSRRPSPGPDPLPGPTPERLAAMSGRSTPPLLGDLYGVVPQKLTSGLVARACRLREDRPPEESEPRSRGRPRGESPVELPHGIGDWTAQYICHASLCAGPTPSRPATWDCSKRGQRRSKRNVCVMRDAGGLATWRAYAADFTSGKCQHIPIWRDHDALIRCVQLSATQFIPRAQSATWHTDFRRRGDDGPDTSLCQRQGITVAGPEASWPRDDSAFRAVRDCS